MKPPSLGGRRHGGPRPAVNPGTRTRRSMGQGEWEEEKHGRARRSWRKLHLAVDADTGEIVACTLTDNAADDAGQVPALLGQIEGKIASVAADRSEEHTSELQSRQYLVCRLLLEKKK